MEFDRNKLYDSPENFFSAQGSGVMKLTPAAAIKVCLSASTRGLLVARIEGGLWHNPGFEARTDCIWDGVDPPVNTATATKNDVDAAEFVREEGSEHNCFVVTAPPVDGWPHRRL
jgi:Colicin-E5 Imm protein